MKTTEYQRITAPVEKFFVSERNTRQPKPADPNVVSLGVSLKAAGQLTDLIARPHPKKKGCYEIAAGSCRRVAAPGAGLKTLSAKVKPMTDQEFDTIIIVENFQRSQPTPQAEAEVVCRLVDQGMTEEAIAAHLGQNTSWVTRRKRLLKVIPKLRAMWKPEGKLEFYTSEMMELLGSIPEKLQNELAEEAWSLRNFRTRKDIESYLARELLRLDQAPFSLTDPRFFNKATNCGPGCTTDTSKEKDLFDFGNGKKGGCGRCLNQECYKTRLGLYQSARYKELCGDGDLPVCTEEYSINELKLGEKEVRPTRVYEIKTKETPGARKVVAVHASGRLEIGWLPKGNSSSSAEKSVPKSEATKRKEGITMLQGKRWLLVHEKLKKAVRAANLKSLTVPIDDLIATFGLPFHVQASGSQAATKPWAILDARKKGFPPASSDEYSRAKGTPVPREQALWPAMQKVLLGLMPDPWKVSTAPEFEDTYVRVGALIGFDTAAAKKAADLEILPPKSWGKVDPHTLKSIK